MSNTTAEFVAANSVGAAAGALGIVGIAKAIAGFSGFDAIWWEAVGTTSALAVVAYFLTDKTY